MLPRVEKYSCRIFSVNDFASGIILFALIREDDDDDDDDNVDAGEDDVDDDDDDAGEDERVQQLFTNPSKATIRRLLQG